VPDTDSLKSAAAFIAFVLAGLWAYFRPQRAAPPSNSILAGVGIELGNREQTERLISEVHGIRVAVEILADRRTEEMEDIHRELLERLDRQEEQEESGPRKHPPRRR
jgi:hypothetical protein